MDVKYDFITPELFNILFFRQKNLIIFPYVDQEHLQTLEIFLDGYKVDICDATAIYNLKDVLIYSTGYSQIPEFRLILNVDKADILDLCKLEKFRGVINTRMKEIKPDVMIKAQKSGFIIYNKKLKSFPNYSFKDIDLTFETEILNKCPSLEILIDEIGSLRSLSKKIYLALNQENEKEEIIKILQEIKPQYYNKIFEQVSNYYNINVPSEILEISDDKGKNDKELSKDEKEIGLLQYDKVRKINPQIFNIFVTSLSNYKENFNDRNLVIKQYFPENFYVYLKSHHWKENIPEEFLENFCRQVSNQVDYSDDVYEDLKKILTTIGVGNGYFDGINSLWDDDTHLSKIELFNEENFTKYDIKEINSLDIEPKKNTHISLESIPNIDDIKSFRNWIRKKLHQIEELIEIRKDNI